MISTSPSMERPAVRLSLGLEYGLISLVVVTLLVTLALDGTPASTWLAIPRVVAALLSIVFIPGYLIQALFFCDKDDLDIPQRLGLSFVLSLCMPPAIVFALDSVEVTFHMETLLLGLLSIISIFALTSLLRRMLTPAAERFMWTLPTVRLGGVTRSLDTVLWGGVVVGIVGLVIVLAVTVFVPDPNTYLTEFFVLSEAGTAADYPREVVVGESFELRIVILNNEAQPMDYDISAENGDQVIYAADGIHVEVGERLEQMIEVRPVDVNEQSLVLFHLYRSGETEPYRTLRYWVRVETA